MTFGGDRWKGYNWPPVLNIEPQHHVLLARYDLLNWYSASLAVRSLRERAQERNRRYVHRLAFMRAFSPSSPPTCRSYFSVALGLSTGSVFPPLEASNEHAFIG